MFKVAKGGTITINSFLNSNDRDIARDHLLKTASSQMREAAKIGLQSLYADPKDVLEKYKDFDIVKEMKVKSAFISLKFISLHFISLALHTIFEYEYIINTTLPLVLS